MSSKYFLLNERLEKPFTWHRLLLILRCRKNESFSLSEDIYCPNCQQMAHITGKSNTSDGIYQQQIMKFYPLWDICGSFGYFQCPNCRNKIYD